jgi:hypothetical protein
MVFSQKDKDKIWVDYMVTQMGVKHHLFIFELIETKIEGLDDSYKKYTTLNIATKQLCLDSKHVGLDDFCVEDTQNNFGINGWYWRFKDRIFK